MPIYSYACEACQTSWEGYQSLTTSPAPLCGCGLSMEKVWAAPGQRPANGYPYTTSHITGKPIEVRSALHEAELCKQHGVVKRDDTSWIEKRYEGYDLKSRKQKYTEGSGRGLPGQWV